MSTNAAAGRLRRGIWYILLLPVPGVLFRFGFLYVYVSVISVDYLRVFVEDGLRIDYGIQQYAKK